MVKALAAFLLIYGFLGIMWMVFKDSTRTKEQRKTLKKTLLFSGGLITITFFVLIGIVILF